MSSILFTGIRRADPAVPVVGVLVESTSDLIIGGLFFLIA